jgi:hypothetical protein
MTDKNDEILCFLESRYGQKLSGFFLVVISEDNGFNRHWYTHGGSAQLLGAATLGVADLQRSILDQITPPPPATGEAG